MGLSETCASLEKSGSALLIAYHCGEEEEEFHVVWTFEMSGDALRSDPFHFGGAQWYLEVETGDPGEHLAVYLCQPEQKVRQVRVSLKMTCHPTDETVEADATLRYDEGDVVGWSQLIAMLEGGVYTLKVCLAQ